MAPSLGSTTQHATLLCASVLLLAGCGEGSKSPPQGQVAPAAQDTELALYLTDAPLSPEVARRVHVSIEQIEARGPKHGWRKVLGQTKRFNLLELQNGKRALLCKAKVPAGTWNEFRFRLGGAEVELGDGRVLQLPAPRATTKEGWLVRLSGEAKTSRGRAAGVLFDFNLARSFDARRGPNGKITAVDFTPVILPSLLASADEDAIAEEPPAPAGSVAAEPDLTAGTSPGANPGGGGAPAASPPPPPSPITPPPPSPPSGLDPTHLHSLLGPVTLDRGLHQIPLSPLATSGTHFLTLRRTHWSKPRVRLNGQRVFPRSEFHPVYRLHRVELALAPGQNTLEVQVRRGSVTLEVVSLAPQSQLGGLGQPVVEGTFACERFFRGSSRRDLTLPSGEGLYSLEAKPVQGWGWPWWSTMARVEWNGERVLSYWNFYGRPSRLVRPITVSAPENELKARVLGARGAKLDLCVIGWAADTEPPTVTVTSPGACVGAGSPIEVTFQDELAGIAPGGFSAFLNGHEITSAFALAAGSASAPSLSGLPGLLPGSNELLVRVYDQAGNLGETTQSFTLDETPPVLTKIPAEGALIRHTSSTPAVVTTTAVIEVASWTPDEAASTHSNSSGDHALWLPDLPGGPIYLWEGSPRFYEYSTGEAYLRGRVVSANDANKRWRVEIRLNRTAATPKLELQSQHYAPGGPIDPATWHFYDLDPDHADLVGEGDFAGKSLQLYQRPINGPYAFQAGAGANGKNLNFGLSGWFGYTGDYSGQRGDINVDLNAAAQDTVAVPLCVSYSDAGCGLDAATLAFTSTLNGIANTTSFTIGVDEAKGFSGELAEGTQTWEVSATDAAGNTATQTCTFTVQFSLPLRGFVATGETRETFRGVAGATVRALGVPGEPAVTSDAFGRFEFPLLPSGSEFRLVIDGTAQGLGRIHVPVPAAREELLATIPILPQVRPLEGTRLQVGPDDRTLVEHVVSDPASGATVTIAAGSLVTPPSDPIGSASVSPVVTLTLQRVLPSAVNPPLPNTLYANYTYSLQPQGYVVQGGFDVRLPNDLGLPAGASTPLYLLNPDTVTHELNTTLTVSADGLFLEGHTNSHASLLSPVVSTLPAGFTVQLNCGFDPTGQKRNRKLLYGAGGNMNRVVGSGGDVQPFSATPPGVPSSVPAPSSNPIFVISIPDPIPLNNPTPAPPAFQVIQPPTQVIPLGAVLGPYVTFESAEPRALTSGSTLTVRLSSGTTQAVDVYLTNSAFPGGRVLLTQAGQDVAEGLLFFQVPNLAGQNLIVGLENDPANPTYESHGYFRPHLLDTASPTAFLEGPLFFPAASGSLQLSLDDPNLTARTGLASYEVIRLADGFNETGGFVSLASGAAATVSVPATALNEGLNDYQVNVRDQAGNTGTSFVSVRRDTQAPELVLGAFDLEVQGTISVPYTVADENGIDSVSLVHNGVKVASVDGNLPSGTLIWSPPVAGTFDFFVEAEDEFGRTTTLGPFQVLVDDEAPTATITVPTLNANLGPVTLTIDVVENPSVGFSGLASYTLYRVFGSATTQIATGFLGGGQTETITVSDTVSQEGTYTYQIELLDEAGNVGTAASAQVLFDQTPPALQSSSPGDGTLVNTSKVVFVWDVFDLGGLSTITVRLDGNEVTSTTSNPAPGQTTITSTIDKLADGAHQIEVVVEDLVGQSVSFVQNVVVDTKAPVVENLTATPDTPTNAVATDVGADLDDGTGTGVDPDDVLVEVEFQPNPPYAPPTQSNLTSFANITNNRLDVTVPLLGTGETTIKITVPDRAGNVRVVEKKIVSDHDSPSVVIPPQPGFVTTTQPELVANLSDPAGGVGVNPSTTQVFFDGVDVSAQATRTATSASYTPPALSDGPHTFLVTAQDAAGNVTTSSQTFTVDATPPTLPGLPLAGPHPLSATTTLRWLPSSDAGSGIQEYRLSRSEDGGKTFALVSSGPATEVTVPFPAGEGTLFRLQAIDAAGNASAPVLAKGCETFALDDLATPVTTQLRVRVLDSQGGPITSGAVVREVTSGLAPSFAHVGGGLYESAPITVGSGQPLTLEVDYLGDTFVSGPLLPLLPAPTQTDFGVVTITHRRLQSTVVAVGAKSPEPAGQAGLGLTVGEPGAAGPPALTNGGINLNAGFWNTIEIEGDPVVDVIQTPPVLCGRYVPVYFEVISDLVAVDVVTEFSVDGGQTFAPMTIAAGATTNLGGTPIGRRHVVVWDTATDLATLSQADVQLRLSPTGAPARGDTIATTHFRAFSVREVTPSPGSEGLGVSPTFTLTFDADLTTNAANLAASIQLVQLETEVAAPLSFSVSGRSVTITPTSPLDADARYALRVGGGLGSPEPKLFDQFPAQPGIQGFEAAFGVDGTDRSGPRLQTSTPAEGAGGVPTSTSIVLTFSEPLDPSTVSGQTFTLLSHLEPSVPVTTSLGGGDQVVTATATLLPGRCYTLSVSPRVSDAQGNPLGNFAQLTFTTASASGPAPGAPVITSPLDGATLTSEAPTIVGTAPPNFEVRLYLNGFPTALRTSANANGDWTIPTFSLPDGPVSLFTVASYPTGAPASAPSASVNLTVETNRLPGTPPSGPGQPNLHEVLAGDVAAAPHRKELIFTGTPNAPFTIDVRTLKASAGLDTAPELHIAAANGGGVRVVAVGQQSFPGGTFDAAGEARIEYRASDVVDEVHEIVLIDQATTLPTAAQQVAQRAPRAFFDFDPSEDFATPTNVQISLRARLLQSPTAEIVSAREYSVLLQAVDDQGEPIDSITINGVSGAEGVEATTDASGNLVCSVERKQGDTRETKIRVTSKEAKVCPPGDDPKDAPGGESTPLGSSTRERTPQHSITRDAPPNNGSTTDLGCATCDCNCPTEEASKDAPTQHGSKGNNPIYYHSGHSVQSRVDLAIPGRGLSFAFSRTYKSNALYNGPMGQSWTHGYDMRLDQEPSGDVTWLTGSNRNESFASLGGGLYRAPAGFFVRLTVAPSGSEIRTRSGTRYGFRAFTAVIAPGKLASITDNYGNRLEFEYGTSGPAEGQLVLIRDVYQREIVLEYTSEGRIETLRDYLGREVRYTYGTYGDLIRVRSPVVNTTTEGAPILPQNQFPEGKSEIYVYQNGFADERLNHNMVLRIAPNQAKDVLESQLEDFNVLQPLARTENTWDLDPTSPTYGTIIKQRMGGSSTLLAWTEQVAPQEAGGTWSLTRRELTLPASASINHPASVMIRVDRNGNRVELFHNAAGQCVRELHYTNRNVRPESSTPGFGEDPPSFVIEQIYNADGLLIARTEDMGQVTRYFYANEDLNGDGVITPGEDRNNDGDFDDPEDVQPEDTTLYAFNPGNGQLDAGLRFSQSNLVRLERHPDARGDTRGGQRPRIYEYRYEPIYNAMAARVGARAFDPDYTPQNGGVRNEARYTTRSFFDYQQDTDVPATLARLATELGTTPAQVQVLLTDAGIALGLGDLNGAPGDDTRTTGDLVRVEAPTVNLTASQTFLQTVQGDTTQELVTQFEFNSFGQLVRTVDAEGNTHTVSFYPENDPDGDGIADNSLPSPTGGYPSTTLVDALAAPGRNSGTNPTPALISATVRYDRVGNVIETVDARGIAHSLEINALNQVVRARVATRTSNLHPSEPDSNLVAFDYESRVFRDHNNNVTETRVENAGERDGTGLTVLTNPFWTRKTAYDLLDNPVVSLAEVEPVTDDDTITVSSPGVIVSRLAYDPNENVVLVTKPEGNQVAFVYDERDLLFKTIDAVGTEDAAVYTRHYNRNGALAFSVDAHKHNPGKYPGVPGDVSEVVYNGFDEITCQIDAESNFAAWVVDPEGRGTRVVHFGPSEEGNPRLSEAELHYDEAGRLFRTDARIFQTQVTGLPLPTTIPVISDGVPSGETEAISIAEFDRLGRPVHSIDPKGDDGFTEFDGASRALRVLGPAFQGLVAGTPVRNEVQITYNQASQATRVVATDRSPTATQEVFQSFRVYDALGRLARTTDPAGLTSRLAYDSRSNVIAASDAKSSVIQGDPLGLHFGQINGHGNVAHLFYDGISRPLGSDRLLKQGGVGNGSLDLLGYTGLDQSNSAVADGVISTRASYDRNSRRVSKTDDNGNTTRWFHDSRDRVITIGGADSTHSYTYYDADSMVRKTIDRNGTQIDCDYDGLGRLMRKVATRLGSNLEGTGQGVEGTTEQAFEYDGLSRLRVSFDNNRDNLIGGPDDVACSYTYDSLSRRLTERQRFRATTVSNAVNTTNNRITVTPNGSTLDRTVASEFDVDSNRTALTYSSGRRLEFDFDGMDRTQRIRDQSAANLQIVGMEFIGARPRQAQTANGVVTDFQYDLKRRITALDHVRTGTRVAGFSYTWGRADNRASETQEATPLLAAKAQSYTYDSAYRLTQVDFSGGVARPATEYQFDGPGNWVSRTEDGARTEMNRRQNGTPGTPAERSGTYVADSMNEYFRLASFDAAGAFVGDETQTHDKNGNRIQNGEHRLFFDLFDRLVRVERVSDGVTVGNYRYDAAGRRVHKEFLNPASGAQEEVFFVSDGAREIEELDGAGNVVADYVFGSLYIDQVVQMRRGGQDYYLHSNSLFSVAAVTDAAGSVVERYEYGSVYGTVTATDDAGGTKSAAAEIRNPWRFTGRRLDPESGLYHYRLRYYDPAQGRFVSRDPLGMWGDPDQRGVEQGYCGNNPTNLTDPMGDKSSAMDRIISRGGGGGTGIRPTSTSRGRGGRGNTYGPSRGGTDGMRQPSRNGRTYSSNTSSRGSTSTNSNLAKDPVRHGPSRATQTGGTTGNPNIPPPGGGAWGTSPGHKTDSVAGWRKMQSSHDLPFGSGAKKPSPVKAEGGMPTPGEAVRPGRSIPRVCHDDLPPGFSVMQDPKPSREDRHNYHHIFPRKYGHWFEDRYGIDIDNYTLRIPESTHRMLHVGGWGGAAPFPGGGWWNHLIVEQLREAEQLQGRCLTGAELVDFGQDFVHMHGLGQFLPLVPYPGGRRRWQTQEPPGPWR